jgi:hypothetical protein
MGAVRGHHHTLLPGVAEVVKHACAHTNIQPIVGSDQVGGLAGGAHVEGVGVVALHPHHDPDLSGRVMVVFHFLLSLWPGLLVRADVTAGGQWHGESCALRPGSVLVSGLYW